MLAPKEAAKKGVATVIDQHRLRLQVNGTAFPLQQPQIDQDMYSFNLDLSTEVTIETAVALKAREVHIDRRDEYTAGHCEKYHLEQGGSTGKQASPEMDHSTEPTSTAESTGGGGTSGIVRDRPAIDASNNGANHALESPDEQNGLNTSHLRQLRTLL